MKYEALKKDNEFYLILSQIYICILSSTERDFPYITTHQDSLTCEMPQTRIEIQPTLCQHDNQTSQPPAISM